MASHVLRRMSKAELMTQLSRRNAAPYHPIIWDNRPVRIGDALSTLAGRADDEFFYASKEIVYSASLPRK